MKKAILLILAGLMVVSTAFAADANKIRKDDPRINSGKYLIKQEKPSRVSNPNTGIIPVLSTTRNANAVLVDSSSNGYGLVVCSTRPIDNDEDNWIISYRQYAGEATTHGQLGAAWSEDIEAVEDWTVYTNVNSNGNPEWGGGGICEDGTCAQARYPSAVASPDYPYAVWNEYTAAESTYGGRPYYTYDEFGWDGDSYAYPKNIDLLWGGTTDQWVGSAQFTYNEDDDMGIMNVVYNDWTRNNTYLFHSEVIEDGLVIFGTEQTVIDLEDGFFGASDYITSPLMAMDDSGHGAVAVLGIMDGNDPATECLSTALSCAKVPIFKLTDDHGYSFYGPGLGQYYYVPDEVFDDIHQSMVIPSTPDLDDNGTGDGIVVDYCYNYAEDDDFFLGTGADVDYDGDGVVEPQEEVAQYPLINSEWWGHYDWDLRVNADGDIHVIMSYSPASTEFLHYIDGAAGFYHITIKKENINNPGDVNTATGWNWSYLMDAGSTWNYDVDVDGFNESSNTLPQLSFAADDPNVVWAVINLADVGGYADIDTEMAATNCAQWDTYIASVADLSKWSFDLFVLKSVDGGMTWSDAVNVTETEGDFSDGIYNGPEEMYAHTPQYSTSDNVYFMYQMPNWAWNEIGDPTAADHMNYVYVGYAGEDLNLATSDYNEDSNNSTLPSSFELTQNYPNPFNPSTTINFTIPNMAEVKINVFDINGRLVNTLINSSLTSGQHSVVWNGEDSAGNKASAGIYMYTLTSDEVSITNKMILVK